MKAALIGIVGGGGAAATLAGVADLDIPMGLLGVLALFIAHSLYRGTRGAK